MAGVWGHRETAAERLYLHIGSDSRGTINRYDASGLVSDTNPRKWFVKKGRLVFGRISGSKERFVIDSLPVLSTRYFIQNFDTVYPGDRYMVLNGVYFVDRN